MTKPEDNKNPYQEALDDMWKDSHDGLQGFWDKHASALQEALRLASSLHGCRKVYAVETNGTKNDDVIICPNEGARDEFFDSDYMKKITIFIHPDQPEAI